MLDGLKEWKCPSTPSAARLATPSRSLSDSFRFYPFTIFATLFEMSSIVASLTVLASFASMVNAGASGSGVTTRFWDCCKVRWNISRYQPSLTKFQPSCGWPGKASVSNPVQICDINNNPLADANTQSACDGGSSYMCSSQQPFVVSDTLAYGFAAVNIAGGSESTWCCACYALTFTSTSLANSGKTFIVQAVNTGGGMPALQSILVPLYLEI